MTQQAISADANGTTVSAPCGPPTPHGIWSLVPLVLAALPVVAVIVGALRLAEWFPGMVRRWLVLVSALVAVAWLGTAAANFIRAWYRNILDRRRQRRRRLLHEHLNFLAAGPPPGGASLRYVVRRLDDARTVFASYPESQQVTIRRALAEPATDALLKRWRRSNRLWARVQALGLVGWLAHPDAIPSLTEALLWAAPDESYTAAEALGRIDHPNAFGVLLTALELGRLPRSRLAAVLEISAFDDRAPLLARRAATGSKPLRFWVAFLAGRSGDPRTIPLLIWLSEDPDAEVRANAAEALGAFPAAVVPLDAVRRLLADEAWLVRAHAAKAVGQARLTDLTGDVVRCLSDPQWWVRQDAALALTTLGYPAIPSLVDALGSPDKFTRNKSAEVLIAVGIVPLAVEAVQSEGRDAESARSVLTGLARAGGLRAIEAAALSAPVTAAAVLVEILGEAGDLRTGHALVALGEARPQLREQAAQAGSRLLEERAR